MSQQNFQELINSANQHHGEYARSLRALRESIGVTRERADSRSTTAGPASPPLRAQTFASDIISVRERPRRNTLDAPERPKFPSASPQPSRLTVSHHDGEFLPVHDDDLSFIPLLDQPKPPTNEVGPKMTKPILPMSFSDDMLLSFLRDTDFSPEMSFVLEEAIRRRQDIDLAMSFGDFAAYERENYVSSTFEVYEVTSNKAGRKLSTDIDIQGPIKYGGDGPFESPDGIVDAPIVWDGIKNINERGDVVGRITIVQEPTPLMLAALQLVMTPHFDMVELLQHLLSDKPNRGRTCACMLRAFDTAPSPDSSQVLSPPATIQLRQRSFFFAFKYYTCVREGLEPAPWQRYEKRPSDKRLDDHIDIAECSSVLALSLGGDPIKTLRMRSRRSKETEGFIYDTFGPWHILSIQSFPDEQHSVRSNEFLNKTFHNGPYAFLILLISEYHDAVKRNKILHEKITKLITPPIEFMFDRRLRDKLLFEDKNFTYIRRYFWAYNTLAVINTGIKTMVAAYFETFTDEFWDGSHWLLWAHPAPTSPEGFAYRESMVMLRRDLEKAVNDLGDVLKRNERTRKEIENLRDQLFSGSSIKESRRAIDQGDNIRILTMISMIFLPLTFVTSVFGITEFTIPATDWRFPLTMVFVCVPFMIIIFLFQSQFFTTFSHRCYQAALRAWKRRNSPDALDASTPNPEGRKRRLMARGNRGAGASTWQWPWKKTTAHQIGHMGNTAENVEMDRV